MKQILIIIIALFLLSACDAFWGPKANAGQWIRCDDVTKSYRGTHPPAKNVSFGANATVEDYASAGWCTPRRLEKPTNIHPRKMVVPGDKTLNYPYIDIDWLVVDNPNNQSYMPLGKYKRILIDAEIIAIEKKEKRQKYRDLRQSILDCPDRECLSELGLITEVLIPPDIIPDPDPDPPPDPEPST